MCRLDEVIGENNARGIWDIGLWAWIMGSALWG